MVLNDDLAVVAMLSEKENGRNLKEDGH